jgi:opacity protein-like surface antigen
MKKLSIILLMVFLMGGMTTTALGASGSMTSNEGAYELDGSLGFGSGPGDFDAGFGVNFGAGYTMNSIDKNLQARIDVSYFNFERDFFGLNLDYTRVPFTISGRYYLPLNDQLKVFGQVGIETSFDSIDRVDNFGKRSKDEVNVGLTPGAGLEFFVNPQFSVFALARVHMISSGYFSMHFGGAVHF